jgi:hypothetical protein
VDLQAAKQKVNAVPATEIGNLVVRPKGDSEIGKTGLCQRNAQIA